MTTICNCFIFIVWCHANALRHWTIMLCCAVAQREEGKDKACVWRTRREIVNPPSSPAPLCLLSQLSLSPSLFVTLSNLTPSQSPPLSPNAAPHNTAHHSLQYSTRHALTLNLSLTLTARACLPVRLTTCLYFCFPQQHVLYVLNNFYTLFIPITNMWNFWYHFIIIWTYCSKTEQTLQQKKANAASTTI